MGIVAAQWAACAFAAGFFVTGLFPSIESVFGVLTDISLLEIGDIASALARTGPSRARAPTTIRSTSASIAEAAAESIGAHGLLVRVGAYFHDIGKMLKPDYFVENQGSSDNRHDSLCRP